MLASAPASAQDAALSWHCALASPKSTEVAIGRLQRRRREAMAKMYFSALLDRMAAGEEVVITRHGKAVAKLTRADANRSEIDAAIAKLEALRKNATLDGLKWRELRGKGR